MQTNHTPNAPLETLVIAQLTAIRQHEAALHQQFQTSSTANAPAVELQLLQLQQRAERLSRMIDAMGLTGGYHSGFAPAQAIA